MLAGGLKSRFQALEAALDGAVENIVADADSHAADEIGIDLVLNVEVGTVFAAELSQQLGTRGLVEFHRALNNNLAAFQFEAGQALKGCEYGMKIAGLVGGQALDDLAQTLLIQTTGDLTQAEESAGSGGGGFGDLHGRGVGEDLGLQLGERVVVDALLVIGGEDLAGDLGGGGGNQSTELALELRV